MERPKSLLSSEIEQIKPMEMSMPEQSLNYVIAVKRTERGSVPSDWPDSLSDIDGLSVIGAMNPMRVTVEATPLAIDRVQTLYGEYVTIEPIIPHYPQHD